MGASVYAGYVSAFILFYFLKAELGYCKPRVLLSFLDCFLHFGAEGGICGCFGTDRYLITK